jgi:uncharacterized membrane protein YhaH (DUF805 family)
MSFSDLYFSAKGRISRRTYWLKLMVPVIVISIFLSIIDVSTGNFDPEVGIGLYGGIFSLAVLVPSIMMGIKRFHDRDKSGWWMLIALVPVIGGLWLLVELGFLKGTDGPNRFGPPEGETDSSVYRHDAALE